MALAPSLSLSLFVSLSLPEKPPFVLVALFLPSFLASHFSLLLLSLSSLLPPPTVIPNHTVRIKGIFTIPQFTRVNYLKVHFYQWSAIFPMKFFKCIICLVGCLWPFVEQKQSTDTSGYIYYRLQQGSSIWHLRALSPSSSSQCSPLQLFTLLYFPLSVRRISCIVVVATIYCKEWEHWRNDKLHNFAFTLLLWLPLYYSIVLKVTN